eukprot:EC794617.1.p1 GENE.EC794617.1~~EC794617.1.p1  ORF type:complete len:148 (-),score=49.17 EC794617.1:102-545(-)
MIFLRKLGRPSAHREALLRNLVTALVKHEQIITTLPKGKELKRVADQLVTLAKQNTLASRRRALGYIYEPDVVKKLFAEFPLRYAQRNGGYTRVLRMENRRGDNAPMCLVEYVDRPAKPTTTTTTSPSTITTTATTTKAQQPQLASS